MARLGAHHPTRTTTPTPTPPTSSSGNSAARKANTTMKLPGRRAGTPRNPRITPEARAEQALLQQLALKIGQEALRQNGITYTPTHDLPTGGTLATADGYEATHDSLRLRVTLVVDVAPHTTAAIKAHTR